MAIRTKVQDRDSRGFGTGPAPAVDGPGGPPDATDPDAPARPPREPQPTNTQNSFRSKRPGGAKVDYFRFWDAVPVEHQAGQPSTFASAHAIGRDPLLRRAALRIDSSVDEEQRSTIYPWVTFVLGSGCLADEKGRSEGAGSDSDVRSAVEALVDVALAPLQEVQRLRDRFSELRVLTIDFVLETAGERTPGQVRAWASQTSQLRARIDDRFLTEEDRQRAARAHESHRLGMIAALGAALAARLYLDVTVITRTSLAPSQREFVEFDIDQHPQLARIDVSVRQPLREVAKYIGTLVPRGASPAGSALQGIVKSIAEQKRIAREQVEVLRSFAWHFLTSGTNIYPGWADILLFQAAESDTESGMFLDVPMLRRPGLKDLADFRGSEAWLSRRLHEVTRLSWEEQSDGSDSDRETFYRAVAQTLVVQAELNVRSADAPLATAFISGFDLELDMALLRGLRGAEGAPDRFAVVVPVYLVRDADTSYDTTLHWVWKFVDAGGEPSLDCLLGPGEWKTVGSGIRQDLAGVPVVVHLSGAPLIDVESVSCLAAGKVRPALLLDENTSLIQVALDLRPVDGRLPDALSADPPPPQEGSLQFSPRYWMFVGAQLADPSVRLRLLSREIASQWGKADERPDRKRRRIPIDERGVVVNAWSPVAERQLFHWQGFGVVRAMAYELVKDIEELAALVPTQGGGRDE